MRIRYAAPALLSAAFIAALLTAPAHAQQTVLTGQNAFTNYQKEHPGVRRHLTLADLPAPAPQQSVRNQPHMVPRPANAWPQAPAGFKVTLYDNQDFIQPRYIITAPNGDLFLADSGGGRGATDGRIIVFRGIDAQGHPKARETFASGLDHPFGIAFYPRGEHPQWVYVANTTSVVRFPYHDGDMKATGAAQTIVPTLPGYARLTGGGHWTRDVVFSLDNSKMFVSIGSGSNIDNPDTHPNEFHRANVLEYTPEGRFIEVWASGIRNCVGEAINPTTGQLWCSTNERDELGNNLVPDYITSVPEHSFFGWPWYYMGGHQDPRLPQPCADGTGGNPQRTSPLTDAEAASCKHVDLASKVRTPDVLLQPHFASLEMTFYPTHGGEFPAQFDGDGFACEHGSWNKSLRAGYEVIRVPMHDGHATGEYEDFLTGFVTPKGDVWGRPVGVTVAKDGSLFVVDDGSNSIWHVTYTGK